MSLTKQAAHRVVVKIKGLASAKYSPRYITIFLLNCVLKGIVDYDILTLAEMKSLNTILAGGSSTHYYDQKTRQIKHRTRNKEGRQQ